MVSSQKILVLLAASLVLASCETTPTVVQPPESAPVIVEAPPPTAAPSTPPSAPPSAPRVVRSAIVPDDPEPVIKTAAVMRPIMDEEYASPVASPERATAPSVAPTPAPKPAPAEVPAAVIVPPSAVGVAAAAAPAIVPPAALVEEPAAAPPTGITPAESIKTADAPSATPAATQPPPSSLFNNPAAFLKDPKALLQAKIGGVPLWLVALFVLLAFISLVIGFRGRKSPEPSSV